MASSVKSTPQGQYTADKSAALPQRKPVSGIIAALFKAIGLTIRDFLRGIVSPRYWIRIIILVLVSTLINYVRVSTTGIEVIDAFASSDIGGKILGVLCFILYSGGGVSKNAAEVIAGTTAKTVCAAFVVGVISGKMKGTGKGIKLVPGSLFGKYARPSKALAGTGFAMIFYVLTCGKSGYAGLMVVISMCAGVLRALGGKGEILRTLTASLNSHKVNKIRRTNLTDMNAMLAGGAVGSIIAFAAIFFCGAKICIIIGAAAVIVGAVCGLFTRSKSRAEVIA